VSGRDCPVENSLLTKHVVAAGTFAKDPGSTPGASSLRSERSDERRLPRCSPSAGESGLVLRPDERSELRLGKPVNQKWNFHTFTSFKASRTRNTCFAPWAPCPAHGPQGVWDLSLPLLASFPRFPASTALPQRTPHRHPTVASPLPRRRTSDRLSEVRRRGNGGDGVGLGWERGLTNQPFGGKQAYQRPRGRWLNRRGMPAGCATMAHPQRRKLGFSPWTVGCSGMLFAIDHNSPRKTLASKAGGNDASSASTSRCKRCNRAGIVKSLSAPVDP